MDLAEDIARRGNAQGLPSIVQARIAGMHYGGPPLTIRYMTQALDDYPIMELPNESLVVFIVSTTGDGEEPDNMKQAWRFLLRKSLAADSLCGLRYGLFGLGDSSYPKFNAVARRLEVGSIS